MSAAGHVDPDRLQFSEEELLASGDYAEALAGAELVLFVIPAQVVRGCLAQLAELLPRDVPLVICSKGIERGTLATMEEVFTAEDNKLLDSPITDEDVKASLQSANRNSSPGSDGLTYQTYLACWDSLGQHLSDVIREIVRSGKLPGSMRNSFLVFSPKINKEQSTRIKDKRKLSLLQTVLTKFSQAYWLVVSGKLKNTRSPDTSLPLAPRESPRQSA